MKKSVPPTSVRLTGFEEAEPGAMSFSCTVPAPAPSLFHSSTPVVPSLAVKKSVPFTSVSCCGFGAGDLGAPHAADVDGTLFFTGLDIDGGYELWKSDGTEAGTVRVKDVLPGSTSSNPEQLTNVNGTLFFVATDVSGNKDLWKSDGTSAGTVMLRDNITDVEPLEGFDNELTNVNGTLFFAVLHAIYTQELGKSDGTPAGTVSLAANFATLSNFTDRSGTLYFLGFSNPPLAFGLFRSDGTTAGTQYVAQMAVNVLNSPLNGPPTTPFVNANGMLFSHGFSTVSNALWRSDGTAAGTFVVHEGPPLSPFSPETLAAVGSRAVFVEGEELWTSDGTPAGTHAVADIAAPGGSNPDGFLQVGSLVFFNAHTDATGRELWAVPAAALADGDQDGLDDQDEVALGTDPADADSDDDGLTDGAEVNTHGTNPLSADTDGDGYSDFDELANGSNPLDPNSPAGVPLAAPWALAGLALLLVSAARGRARNRV
jgi:ELWxxDGT repeat protein